MVRLSDLASRCADRDPAAWRELVETHRGLVLRSLVKLVDRDREALLDLEQDLWMRLAGPGRANLREVAGKGPAALRRLLATYALNLGRDHLRRRGVRRNTVSMDEASFSELPVAGDENPERAAELSEQRARILDAAERVAAGSERNLFIFRLFHEAGFTADEISRMGVGLAEKGVEGVILRMTRRVRDLLTRPPTDPPEPGAPQEKRPLLRSSGEEEP